MILPTSIAYARRHPASGWRRSGGGNVGKLEGPAGTAQRIYLRTLDTQASGAGRRSDGALLRDPPPKTDGHR